MTESQRQVLLVGSMPFENEADAMSRAITALGADLVSLPDGEIGEKSDAYPQGNRAAWTQTIIDFCEQEPKNFDVVRPGTRGDSGFPIGYDAEPRLKPKHPPSQIDKHLNFRWLDYFKQSYPIFKQLREEQDLPHLKFQIGLPTGMGVTFPMMNPINALRYASAFNKRMAFEANEMLKLADPGDLLFQIEVPAEMAMAYRLPNFMVNLSLRTVIGLVEMIKPQALFGIHLCFGDLNNEALTKSETLDKMVNFTNGLVEKWPKTHELNYLHFPLAEAADPPPMTADYYRPLQNINLPPNVRFVAGFVHNKRSEAEHMQILQTIEGIRGHQVDIACSCGLGRQTPESAMSLIQLSNKLVKA